MEILEKALEMEQNGIDVIHFEIGEPDFDTPYSIINGCFSEIKEFDDHRWKFAVRCEGADGCASRQQPKRLADPLAVFLSD